MPVPALSRAAFDGDGRLAGLAQSWPVTLMAADGGRHDLVLVGPVAVAATMRGHGLGQRLMTAILGAADQSGARALMLVGDPEFYGRFGFSATATAGWEMPGPVERRRLLARLNGITLPHQGRLVPFAPVLDV